MATPDPLQAGDRHKVEMFQLEQAYESARAIFNSSLQFMTVAAGAEVAAVTIAVERKSALLLLLGGIVVVVLIYQLMASGRAFSATVVSALSIENALGLTGRSSLMSGFFGATYGAARLKELRKLATAPGADVEEEWIDKIAKHAIFRRGLTTTLALVFGLSQMVLAIILLVVGWP